MTSALIVFLLMQLADTLTTMEAFRRGAVEKNPALRWLMARLGQNRALLAYKLVLCIGVVSAGLLGYLPTWAAWIASIPTGIVVGNNLLWLRRN